MRSNAADAGGLRIRPCNERAELLEIACGAPKGPVSLRFPADALDMLFLKLFPEM